jgi:hypothetical protein
MSHCEAKGMKNCNPFSVMLIRGEAMYMHGVALATPKNIVFFI